ncbi:MAG: hypothetical protein ACE5HP_02275 [Gemmatimonadota bacterium]
MRKPHSPLAGYRVAGAFAIAGGLLRLAIASAFAVTGLGAADDLPYGAFSRFTFLPSGALVLSMAALYGAAAHTLPRGGGFGVLVALLGLLFSTVGEVGGQWLAFPRSGNLLIGPGAVLTMLGLGLFALHARRRRLGAGVATSALSIALLPVLFFPLAAGIEVLAGNGFPPALHDNYFRVLYSIVAACWIMFGVALLREVEPSTSLPLEPARGK